MSRDLLAAHPNLRALCVDMCACNGGINRNRSEEAFLVDLAPMFSRWVNHSPSDGAQLEAWLATLSEDDRLTIADGDREEAVALLSQVPGGQSLDQFLNDVFDEAV